MQVVMRWTRIKYVRANSSHPSVYVQGGGPSFCELWDRISEGIDSYDRRDTNTLRHQDFYILKCEKHSFSFLLL